MSESQNEDSERKERARRVAALAGASRQSGERARLGTRIVGAVAVLALAAAATLGIGAWHSYQAEAAAKEAKADKARKKEEAAASNKATTSPSEKRRGEKKQQEKEQKPLREESVDKPTKTVKEPEKNVRLNSKSQMVGAGYSRVALGNQQTNMCADLPYYGDVPDGAAVSQYPCNTSTADNQTWNITVSHTNFGPDKINLMMLANTKDGDCLDVPGYGAKPAGTHLQSGVCNGKLSDNQQWHIESQPNGSKRLHNVASKGLCLQVARGSDKQDAPLAIGPCEAESSNWFLRQ